MRPRKRPLILVLKNPDLPDGEIVIAAEEVEAAVAEVHAAEGMSAEANSRKN